MTVLIKADVDIGFVAGVCAGAIVSLIAYRNLPLLLQARNNQIKTKYSVGYSWNNSRPASSQVQDEPTEERVAERDAFWFEENLTPVYSVKLAMNKLSFEARSEFQLVQIIETKQFGRTLVMDGQTQSAETDEHIYHESLVHPAMLLHPNPKSVYIGGGGEFATAREVLKHRSVEKCTMVDIDRIACDICREHLPEWNDGAYEDSRFKVYYMDAKQWLEENAEAKFDVIILDICDPIEAGPAYKLYTQEFYKFLETRLNKDGIVVTQSGPGAVYNAKEECFSVINNTLQSAYNCVLPYVVDVPSFGCAWGFNIAILNNSTKESRLQAEKTRKMVYEIKGDHIDNLITARIQGPLKFLDGISFKGLFGIPKSIREACASEDRIMTIANPVFMFAG